jgi:UDP-galactopyranose mutase
MPKDGYTAMFNRMLDHPNIDVLLSTDYEDVDRRGRRRPHRLHRPGRRIFRLPLRQAALPEPAASSIRCSTAENFQPVAVVNYPDPQVPYTRITEYKHLTGQKHPKTSITYEYPSAEGDPYYPIPRAENQALYKKYEALADATRDVTFVGRLATYRYYNMDQVVGQALATFRRLQARVEAEAASKPDFWTEAAEYALDGGRSRHSGGRAECGAAHVSVLSAAASRSRA